MIDAETERPPNAQKFCLRPGFEISAREPTSSARRCFRADGGENLGGSLLDVLQALIHAFAKTRIR